MARNAGGTRTTAGARTARPARTNYSLSFDGTTAYVQFNRQSAYNLVNFSIEMWVKGAAQTDKRIFSEGRNSSNTPSFSFGTNTTGSQKLKAFLRTDASSTPLGSSGTLSTTNVFDDTWHHILWVDASGTVTLYIDKIADATNFSYTRATTTLDRTAIATRIGNATATSMFAGNIDQVRIFNKALNQTEVNACFANDSGIPRSNLIYEWKFDEGSGLLVTSTGNNALQGVITAATFSSTNPGYASAPITRSAA